MSDGVTDAFRESRRNQEFYSKQLDRKIKGLPPLCNRCFGSGKGRFQISGAPIQPCKKCNGTGIYRRRVEVIEEKLEALCISLEENELSFAGCITAEEIKDYLQCDDGESRQNGGTDGRAEVRWPVSPETKEALRTREEAEDE